MQFYDLKICIEPETNIDDLLDRIKTYNYHTIGINLTLKDSKDFFLEIKKFRGVFEHVLILCVNRNINCIKRLTVVTGKPFNRQHFKECKLDWFDLIAIIPTTQEALTHASHRTDIDIIAFDSCTFSNLKIGRNIDVAINNKIHFEFEYAAAILGGKRARIFLFEQAYTILRRCRQQNIIMSSGASQASYLRNPDDVINLGVMSGLGIKNAFRSLTANPESVMYHGYARERTLYGIFELIPKFVHESPILVDETQKFSPANSKIKRKIETIDYVPFKIPK